MNFETIIGLEVHAQLNTKTKIFCSCPTSFGEEANSQLCPTCLALPGALPVLNEAAVKKALLFGRAINAKLNDFSIFNRKNYFYPDLPKAYQISQFDLPIVEAGELFIPTATGEKRIGITRAHLEEDAGKNLHEGEFSKIDLNRASTPLLEIVSEPDLRSSEEAVAYLKRLHALIRFLKISDANMQEGSFRCDANVSIRPVGDPHFYTRVEIKNLNSFRFIQKAIDYEVARQREAWEGGIYEREVVQETRLFNSTNFTTRAMRTKEESAEYRYFPEPDLRPVALPEGFLDEALPELPEAKKKRFIAELGLREEEAGLLVSQAGLCEFFEELIAQNLNPKLCVSWLNTELLGLFRGELGIENSPVGPDKLGLLIARIEDGTISAKAAKDLLAHIFENPSAAVDETISRLGLRQVSDDAAIGDIISKILADNADKVVEFKAGKEKLFGFFVGQVMKQGAFNPAKVNELLRAALA